MSQSPIMLDCQPKIISVRSKISDPYLRSRNQFTTKNWSVQGMKLLGWLQVEKVFRRSTWSHLIMIRSFRHQQNQPRKLPIPSTLSRMTQVVGGSYGSREGSKFLASLRGKLIMRKEGKMRSRRSLSAFSQGPPRKKLWPRDTLCTLLHWNYHALQSSSRGSRRPKKTPTTLCAPRQIPKYHEWGHAWSYT